MSDMPGCSSFIVQQNVHHYVNWKAVASIVFTTNANIFTPLLYRISYIALSDYVCIQSRKGSFHMLRQLFFQV